MSLAPQATGEATHSIW